MSFAGTWTLVQMREFLWTVQEMANSGSLISYDRFRSASHRNRGNMQNFVGIWLDKRPNATGLEIFTKTIDFAHGIGATPRDAFAVISGEKRLGFTVMPGKNFGKPTPRGKYSTVDAVNDLPPGKKPLQGIIWPFRDPWEEDNHQVHHIMYYTQLAYKNKTVAFALSGNVYHEYIQDIPGGRGQSHEDFVAGVYGAWLGYELRENNMTLQELATNMRDVLGP